MQPFLRYKGREYYLEVVERPPVFTRPFPAQPYPCLLWNTRSHWTEAEREFVAEALIESDCRYVVAGGHDCEQWHDDVDFTFVAGATSEGGMEKRFVMTSWHSDETPDDVAFFFVLNTNFDEHDFNRFLVLQLGRDEVVSEALRSAVARHVKSGDSLADTIPGAG